MSTEAITDAPLGARFAAARKRLGWSLRDAGRASGVPNAHISQIETGAIVHPGPAVVAKLAKAYGMDDLQLPPQAITDAYAAYQRAWLTHNQNNPLFAEKVVREVVEAAEPAIRTEERAKVQHTIDRVARTAAAAQEKAVEMAVAAERERIRRSARERLDALGRDDFSPEAQLLADILLITGQP